jgi:hypothetical protein
MYIPGLSKFTKVEITQFPYYPVSNRDTVISLLSIPESFLGACFVYGHTSLYDMKCFTFAAFGAYYIQ